MVTIWIGVVLAVGTLFDIRTRRLPMVLIIIGGLSGILYQLLVNGMDGIGQFNGMIVGILMLVTSFIVKTGIGLGDGILFLILGMFYPLYSVLELLMKASVMAGVFGLLLIWRRKGNWKMELPFVPFVFIQYVLLQFVNGGHW